MILMSSADDLKPAIAPPPTKTTELQWRDRAWSQVEFDFKWNEHGDLKESARRNGWSLIQTIDAGGFGLELFERNGVPPSEPRFFACYNMPSTWEIVVLPRLQDFIDFLAHVSTTMLVTLLPRDAGDILHDLYEKSPWRIEQRRRERERERERERDVSTRDGGSEADGRRT